MIKKILILVFISALSWSATAQNQADNWFFGVLAKLDFTGGAPVASSGPLNTSEGCSSISSAAGNTLFYTEGVNVWDASNTLMPNGTGLMGEVSSTQSALIVPAPGSSTQYYIFTTDADGGANGFRYTMVDMTLNAGMGDVVTSAKNVPILDTVTEKIAAIKAAGDSYWIVTHKWKSNDFYAYRLTSTGLQPPVISSTGTVHNDSVIQNTYGQMKFNMCGDKLAVAIGYQNLVELFDFNITTGVVSNPQSLPQPERVYGVEFSPNATYLYISCYDPAGTLLQYNISSGVASLIAATRVPLSVTPDIYGLQLGPDGVIYCSKSFSNMLPYIASPNLAGFACAYTEPGIDLDPTFSGCSSSLSLPGFMQTYLKDALNITCTTVDIPEDPMADVRGAFPNPSSDDFLLDLSTLNGEVTVSVYDHSGRLIESLRSRGLQSIGGEYSSGVYFVNLQYGQSMKVFKIVKL